MDVHRLIADRGGRNPRNVKNGEMPQRWTKADYREEEDGDGGMSVERDVA